MGDTTATESTTRSFGSTADPPAEPPPGAIASGALLRLVSWWDPDLAFHGFDARSEYTERYWLPVLGPSALLALRWSAEMLAAHPEGVSVGIPELARHLGLGKQGGASGPAPRAMQRLVYFGLARERSGTLMVRTHVPPVPPLMCRRLPKALQDSHSSWLLRSGESQQRRSAQGRQPGLPATGA